MLQSWHFGGRGAGVGHENSEPPLFSATVKAPASFQGF